MNIRTVIGWRTKALENARAKHSQQFAQARMPGKDAAKLQKKEPKK